MSHVWHMVSVNERRITKKTGRHPRSETRDRVVVPRRRKGLSLYATDVAPSGQDQQGRLGAWLPLALGADTHSLLAAEFFVEKVRLMLVGHLIFVRIVELPAPENGRQHVERL